MKKKLSRNKLFKWLKSATGISLLSISFSNNISTVISNVTSPFFVAKAMEQRLDAFPKKGMYIVEYERNKNDNTQPDIPYLRTVWAMAYDANITSGGKILNIKNMLADISDYEYFVTSNDDAGAYKITSVIVRQPEDPFELEILLKALNKHASFVSVEDGSGTISLVNSFINGEKFT